MNNPTRILTPTQTLFLDLFAKTSLTKDFYLTGGTALTGFYLPFRLSDDLDFFSEKEVDLLEVSSFLKSVKNMLGYQTFDTNTSFNRNLFFLKFDKFVLKTEFTYFPFTPIGKPSNYKGINIDSKLDIAVNKLFTIYQKPRSRDYMDLYLLLQDLIIPLSEITKKAKIKFDWHIDPVKLGAQFLKCKELKDYPRLVEDLKASDWQNFFLSEAERLKTSILK